MSSSTIILHRSKNLLEEALQAEVERFARKIGRLFQVHVGEDLSPEIPLPLLEIDNEVVSGIEPIENYIDSH